MVSSRQEDARRRQELADAALRNESVAAQVLIEQGGQLVDFHRDAHPYR